MSLLRVNLVHCLSDHYSYIISNPITKKAIVVDPAEAEPVINSIEKLGLKLEYILITHHHADHVGGNHELKGKYNCKIIGFKNDSGRIPGIDIQIKDKVRNCEFKNLDNILAELYKRLIIPLYLPALMLVSLFLIIHSKEKINYSRYRLIIFLIGFFLIIFSESTLKFVDKSFYNNLLIGLMPFIIIIFLYFYIISKLSYKKKLKKS